MRLSREFFKLAKTEQFDQRPLSGAYYEVYEFGEHKSVSLRTGSAAEGDRFFSGTRSCDRRLHKDMGEQAFTGFSAGALTLLRDLAKNNDRAWFTPRKGRFEAELFNPLRALVEDTSAALGKARIPIRGDAKRSTFRIYRDVRFSPDKRPYKTHVSAYLSYDGEKNTPGGLYIHVQPAQSFCAVAFYGIEKPLLARWRAKMAAEPASFRKMLKTLERNGLTLDGPGDFEDALKRMPRGFEAQSDSDIADYFRLHSFVVRRHLKDKELASPDLVRELVTLAKNAKPLLEYGWALV